MVRNLNGVVSRAPGRAEWDGLGPTLPRDRTSRLLTATQQICLLEFSPNLSQQQTYVLGSLGMQPPQSSLHTGLLVEGPVGLWLSGAADEVGWWTW